MLNGIYDGLGIIAGTFYGKHAFGLDKMDRKKDRTASGPDDRIQFGHRKPWMVFHERLEVLYVPSDATGFVHFICLVLFPLCKAYLAGKVHVSSIKKTVVNKTVKRTFANHNGIRIGDTYMVDGMVLPEQRRNNFIQMQDFLLCQGDTGAGFAPYNFVFTLRWNRLVQAFFQRTMEPELIAVAIHKGAYRAESSLREKTFYIHNCRAYRKNNDDISAGSHRTCKYDVLCKKSGVCSCCRECLVRLSF